MTGFLSRTLYNGNHDNNHGNHCSNLGRECKMWRGKGGNRTEQNRLFIYSFFKLNTILVYYIKSFPYVVSFSILCKPVSCWDPLWLLCSIFGCYVLWISQTMLMLISLSSSVLCIVFYFLLMFTLAITDQAYSRFLPSN